MHMTVHDFPYSFQMDAQILRLSHDCFLPSSSHVILLHHITYDNC